VLKIPFFLRKSFKKASIVALLNWLQLHIGV